ncbi:MAG: thioredoxin [bacterium]|nr:MAG: thioredoxin [bacterium]
MGKGTFRTLPVLLLAVLTAVVLSPAVGHSFWYGNEISTEHIDELTAENLHQYIVENILDPPRPPGTPSPFADSLRGVDNNPDGITGLRIYKPEKTWDGYTLLSSLGGHLCDPPRGICNAILIDMNGEMVKEWLLGAVPAKMLPGGDVIGSVPERNDTGFRGSKTLQQQDWCGNEVWRYDNFGEPGGADWHHDHEREGNPVGYYAPGLRPYTDWGKTLILSHGYPGVIGTISTFPLLDDRIYEIDWDGTILFDWYAKDHFDQMGFHAEARDAIMNIQVGRPPTTTTDWQHFNSASYLGPNKWYGCGQGDLRFHPDNIIFDSRTANYMGIIARYDHPEGKWQAGDIIWKVGPHFSASYPEHKIGQIIGLHMAHMIPRGLPGAGNILVFDNGGIAGFDSFLPGMPGYYPATYRNYSRVIEFDPITLDIVWEYMDPVQEGDVNGDGEVKGDERKFYSNLISGAQRLKNGNTLITEGHGGRVFEVTYEGEIVWEYISPYEDGRAPRATDPNSVYRAYRVPYWWVPKYNNCDGEDPPWHWGYRHWGHWDWNRYNGGYNSNTCY